MSESAAAPSDTESVTSKRTSSVVLWGSAEMAVLPTLSNKPYKYTKNNHFTKSVVDNTSIASPVGIPLLNVSIDKITICIPYPSKTHQNQILSALYIHAKEPQF